MDNRTKWNIKYQDRLKNLDMPAPNPRLKNLYPYLLGGSALDLACGLGGNSLYLASLNYQVQAVDISGLRLNIFKNRLQRINAISHHKYVI